MLLAAPTRTGKGVGFCIPNLLQFQESAVVLDIKGENYNLTSEFRRRYMGNEIFYFNPFSENTHRWNPLSYISTDPNFRTNDLMALASIIYPVNEKDPFWSDSAKNLFVGLGLLVLETPELPQTIGEILRQGSGKGHPIENYLKHVLAVRASGDRPLSAACRDSLNRFLDNAETTLKGIVGSFSAALTPWGNPVIDKATSGDDFDLRDVRKKKMTVYLHIPAGEILQASFIVNLFFSQLINENVKELPEQNPALKYQCLLLLDEFTAMGKVAIIAKGVGYMAGYNMRLAIIIQDKTQLDAVYGKEDAHNIVSNMGAVIYFTPSQVSEAEEYSKMIGYDTVKSSSVQLGKGSLFGSKDDSSGSETESYQSRALMLPQELLSMSKNQQLVVRSGIPVIMAGKIRYFEDAYFKERFNAVPMQQVTIGTERRSVPVPVALPKGTWEPYHASIPNSDYYLKQGVQTAAPESAPVPETAANEQVNESASAAKADNANVAATAPVEKEVAVATASVAAAAKAADPTPAQKAKRKGMKLPPLPMQAEPFGKLHARLCPSSPIAPNTLSSLAAYKYADSMVRYWQLAQFSGALDAEAPLVILDLTPGDGSFSWQMMQALMARLQTLPFDLPGVQYIACADDQAQHDTLQAHPYFAEQIAQENLVLALRADIFNAPQGFFGANPIVIFAHGLMSYLPQSLMAIHYGSVLAAQATVLPVPTPEAEEIALEYTWPQVATEELAETEQALLQMYCSSLNSSPLSLPLGAMQCMDALAQLSNGRFLLLAADPAITEEREIRLGAFSAPAQLHFPSEPLPANYHALAAHLRAGGAQVSLEKIAGSTLGFCLALRDDSHPKMAQTLAELQTGLSALHAAPATALALQQPEASLSACLNLLQQTHYEPQVLETLYAQMKKAEWGIAASELEQWQQALAQVWEQYLPLPNAREFEQKIVWLALQVGHFGLARQAGEIALALHGEAAELLWQLAICEAETGAPKLAAEHLRAALEVQPENQTCMHLLREMEQRSAVQAKASWWTPALATTETLRLEPLAEHHIPQLLYQFRDPQIASMVQLPRLTTQEQAQAWIVEQQSACMSCAVLHQSWGFVGVVSLQRAAQAGQFYFWIGADYQARGYGTFAAQTFLRMMQATGVQEFYCASFADNVRATRALTSLGFSASTSRALPPNEDLRFFHRGQLQDKFTIHDGFSQLLQGVNSRVQLQHSELETAS